MSAKQKMSYEELVKENKALCGKLDEAGELLTAIRTGTVDALVVEGPKGEQVYSLIGADHPYRIFVEHMNDGAVTIDENGIIVYANRLFAKLVSLSSESTIGRELVRFLSPDERVQWDDLIRETNGEPCKRELTLLSASGESIPILLSAHHLPIEPGRFYCCIVSDLRGQRLHEQLRQSEARFRAFTSATNDIVYCMSPDWSEMRHLRGREFIPDGIRSSRTWLDSYIHPDDQRYVIERIQRAIRSKSVFELEHRVIRVDGSLGWTHSRAIPILDDRGEIVEWFGAASDVTQRKEVEQALHESEEKLRTFAVQLEGLVAERTKELVQSQGRLRALATELNLAEQRERKRLATELHDYLAQLLVVGKLYLERIKSQAGAPLCQELDETLDEALTYTRTLMAQLSPPFFHELGLLYAFKWLAEQMEPRGLHLSVESQDGSLLLTDDHATLLFQAARELLMNVVKHAETDQARLAMTTAEGTVRIEISDDGRGFDVDALSSTSASETQARFGLFSIRERMIAMGGRFELVSRPGKGTRATLIAPLNRAGVARIEESHPRTELTKLHEAAFCPQSSAGSSTKIRALLVDDHAMVRQGLRSILDAYADVEIVGEAAAGDEAVALVDQLRPSVVVMDVNMPRMNGIEATAKIKARHSGVVVIGLSVQTDELARTEMLRAGAAALMTKEAAIEELYHTIQKELQERISN